MTSLVLLPVAADGVSRGFTGTVPDAAREALAATASLYAAVGFQEPWIGYLAVRGETPVGMCGFKSPPVDGCVEIAYFTFPDFEGQGVASAMARRLVALTGDTDPRIRVTAQTLPERNASTRVLEKLGFRRTGTAEDEEVGLVWAWELSPLPDTLAAGGRS